MYQGRPQPYGTQFIAVEGRWQLWDVDPATSDSERATHNVPPLAEQLERAAELTLTDPPDDAGE